METKNILKSKTFWFNLFAGLSEVTGLVPERLQPYFILVVTVGNIILRSMTDTPVTILPNKEEENGPTN